MKLPSHIISYNALTVNGALEKIVLTETLVYVHKNVSDTSGHLEIWQREAEEAKGFVSPSAGGSFSCFLSPIRQWTGKFATKSREAISAGKREKVPTVKCCGDGPESG